MAAGTGGSPSVTRLSFGVTTSDWANAGRGRMRAAVRSRHESLGMCAPTGDVGGQSYGAPSPIYRPPHSFPRTPDDREGGGGRSDGLPLSRQPRLLPQAGPQLPAHRAG